MADQFSDLQWAKIVKKLNKDSARFGMPEGGREGSLVFGSFNIRKLSSRRNRKTELDFLARFCACCDLVSIQEVQDNLDGLRQPRVNRAINVAFAVLLVASVALALLF